MSRIQCAALVLGVGVLTGLSAPAYAASASSISVDENFIIERSYERPRDTEPQQISRRDCEENANIQFPVNVRASSLEPLEVWMGAGVCDTPEELSDRGQCTQIYTDNVSTGTRLINIPAQQIVGADCSGEQDLSTPIERTLFFAFSDAAGEPTTTGSDTITITYDVEAPPPPPFTSLGRGDGQLVPRWEVLETSDLVGYRFYCDPGAAADVTAPGAGGEGGAGSVQCATSLTPGSVPDETLFCGEQAGQQASRGTISNLNNDQLYAVGITSTDFVGNVGVLSDVLCATPREVTDYFEAYTQAGGKGGGGFCALGRDGRSGASGLTLLGFFGVLLLRRRNQRR